MKYFGCCLVLFSLCLMGFGPNETPQTNPGQKLGELWGGLKANSPDVSEAFKDQIFEIPVLVLNDCSSDSPRTDAGGQISLIALTPMESEALSGPQRFTLRLSRQQYSDLKIGQSSSLLQWATVEVVADTFLYHARLVLAVNPDKKQAEFKDGPTLWEVPAELWREQMIQYLRQALLASMAFHVESGEYPLMMKELTPYGFRPWCSVHLNFEIVDGGNVLIISAVSPDGKYRFSYGTHSDDKMKVVEIATKKVL